MYEKLRKVHGFFIFDIIKASEQIMFRFLKSKKGFTLVELMIVVVIMAILVAVAVPIYSAVTKNSKKKTCVANQRQIVSQLTNRFMSNVITYAPGTIKIVTNSTGDGVDEIDMDGVCSEEEFIGMFVKSPYCPIENNRIFVVVEKGVSEGEVYIRTYCESADGTITDHEYNPES